MSGTAPRTVLERLRVIVWNDWDQAFGHRRSRALLMREYLRRAACWARAYGAERVWPFFDIVEYIDPTVQVDDDVLAELDELSSHMGTLYVRTTCQAAVRWAALREKTEPQPSDLPDLYEPLLLMYERGGGFYIEEFIELNGIAIRRGNVETNLAATPFLTLAPATLDAMDAEGKITYYAKIDDEFPRDNPMGIVRRRIDGDLTYDEAFTRNLHWEPTEYLRLYQLGHNDVDHVQISAIEAAAFVEKVSNKVRHGAN
ncbi:hypothetical protein [Streptomyces sp. B6B3]|uniref:hypothetical protein n=1 Tax=Streptomyces sp. B6B3 TaxID=3153570 RepID=UPI00325E1FD1